MDTSFRLLFKELLDRADGIANVNVVGGSRPEERHKHTGQRTRGTVLRGGSAHGKKKAGIWDRRSSLAAVLVTVLEDTFF